jgi:hypothetical protein
MMLGEIIPGIVGPVVVVADGNDEGIVRRFTQEPFQRLERHSADLGVGRKVYVVVDGIGFLWQGQ